MYRAQTRGTCFEQYAGHVASSGNAATLFMRSIAVAIAFFLAIANQQRMSCSTSNSFSIEPQL